MTAMLATLGLGLIIGYLGQRSRLCFISGYRDYFLMKSTEMLRGPLGAFLGATLGYMAVRALGGDAPGFPFFASSDLWGSTAMWIVGLIVAVGVGAVGAMAGGCPYRMHVVAAEGGTSAWYYLGGFYLGIIFYELVTDRLVQTVLSLN